MDFSGVSVLCLGDVMLDRFVHGDIDRISPEAPVPVLRLRETREMPGGAGNVACNIASLGGRAVLIGLVGQDDMAARLRARLAALVGITEALVASIHRPTICKTRFIAGRQQVVRTDDESTAGLTEDEEAALLNAVQGHIGACQAAVLSDYGKSALAPSLVARVVQAARRAGIPVFVDPKSDDFGRYRGATCITPNLRELAAAARCAPSTEAEIAAAARPLLDQAEAHAILVTRSEHGMTLVERSGEVTSVAARAREVFDVSGAGDTVIAALALANATDTTPSVAAVRQYRSRSGVGLNFEQGITDTLGVFARAGFAEGGREPYEFTDTDRNFSAGLSLIGRAWGRPDDTVGLGAVVDAVSHRHKQYLAAGGLGILIGDGALPSAGPEQVAEAYYRYAVTAHAQITADYQFINNPAYDRARGPVSVLAARLHIQY